MTGEPFYKVPRMESEDYLAYVRSLPCAFCGNGCRSEAHHRVGHGRLSTSKVDDYETMPLCRECHSGLHGKGWSAWEATHRTQHEMIAETLTQALRDGVLTIDRKAARGIAA